MRPSAVPRGIPLYLGTASKFTAPPDQGTVQQPLFGQILQQGRHGLVHFGQFSIHGDKMLLVRVPSLVVNSDIGDAMCHQAPGHEAGLAKGIASITVSHGIGFLGQVEQFACLSKHQIIRLVFALI